MTRYEQLMNNMTIQQMCDKNVQLITINDKRLGWSVSTGHIFPYTERNTALLFEMAWLTGNVDPENAEGLESKKEVAQC